MAGKTSTIIHKTKKPSTDLYQVLGKIEETIQELTRYLAESEDSKHLGIAGQNKLTQKQQIILKQLEMAQKRANTITQLIAKNL